MNSIPIENLKITLEITTTISGEGYVLEVSGYDYRENGRMYRRTYISNDPPVRIHCRTIEDVQSHLLGIVEKLL
jgi:hypothetical protein